MCNRNRWSNQEFARCCLERQVPVQATETRPMRFKHIFNRIHFLVSIWPRNTNWARRSCEVCNLKLKDEYYEIEVNNICMCFCECSKIVLHYVRGNRATTLLLLSQLVSLFPLTPEKTQLAKSRCSQALHQVTVGLTRRPSKTDEHTYSYSSQLQPVTVAHPTQGGF